MFLFIQPLECFIHIFLSRADLGFCWGKSFSPDLDQGQATRLCADGRTGGELQSPEARREHWCCLFQVEWELASWMLCKKENWLFSKRLIPWLKGLYWSVQFSKKVKMQKPMWLELCWSWSSVICFLTWKSSRRFSVEISAELQHNVPTWITSSRNQVNKGVSL